MIKHSYKVHAWDVFSFKGQVRFFLFTEIIDETFYREILIKNLFENTKYVMRKY